MLWDFQLFFSVIVDSIHECSFPKVVLCLTVWPQHDPQSLAANKLSSLAAFCARGQLTLPLVGSRKQQNGRGVLQLRRIKPWSVCAGHSTMAVPQARELFCWNQQAPCLSTPDVQGSCMH